jgi:nuclear pore complex protein Nup160
LQHPIRPLLHHTLRRQHLECVSFCHSCNDHADSYFKATPDPKAHYSSSGFLGNTARESFNQGLAKYYAHIVTLYDKEKLFSYVIDFARLALQFLRPDTNPTTLHSRTEMRSRLFNAAVQTSRWDLAHSTLQLFTDRALQISSLRTLVSRLSESRNASKLISLPFLTLQDQVDDILAQKCSSIVDVNAGVAYHKILFAWRIRHNDFRGAASIALDRLQRLQLSDEGDRFLNADGSTSLETPVTRAYVQLINALACVDPEQAWVLAEEIKRGGKKVGKRRVVTLQDVRRAYQEELDRVSAVGKGQFSVVGGDVDGDEMDIL